MQQEEPYF